MRRPFYDPEGRRLGLIGLGDDAENPSWDEQVRLCLPVCLIFQRVRSRLSSSIWMRFSYHYRRRHCCRHLVRQFQIQTPALAVCVARRRRSSCRRRRRQCLHGQSRKARRLVDLLETDSRMPTPLPTRKEAGVPARRGLEGPILSTAFPAAASWGLGFEYLAYDLEAPPFHKIRQRAPWNKLRLNQVV